MEFFSRKYYGLTPVVIFVITLLSIYGCAEASLRHIHNNWVEKYDDIEDNYNNSIYNISTLELEIPTHSNTDSTRTANTMWATS